MFNRGFITSNPPQEIVTITAAADGSGMLGSGYVGYFSSTFTGGSSIGSVDGSFGVGTVSGVYTQDRMYGDDLFSIVLTGVSLSEATDLFYSYEYVVAEYLGVPVTIYGTAAVDAESGGDVVILTFSTEFLFTIGQTYTLYLTNSLEGK